MGRTWHGYRRLGSWRYRVVKHWVHRVQKFKRRAKTVEEIEAWDKVEKWMYTIMENRCLSENGTIVLPKIYPNDLVKIIDIKDMPQYNPKVTDGIDSVSKGLVSWHHTQKAVCKTHGAMLCVTPDRRIWRCPSCHVGCYVEKWSD